MNPGPLAPEARIIRLDQWAIYQTATTEITWGQPLRSVNALEFNRYRLESDVTDLKKGILTLIVKGFEPLPPQRLVPKTSAIDHSATLPVNHLNFFPIGAN